MPAGDGHCTVSSTGTVDCESGVLLLIRVAPAAVDAMSHEPLIVTKIKIIKATADCFNTDSSPNR